MANYYNDKIMAKFQEALSEAKKETIETVTISTGNRKMGAVPSVSLLPFLTCPGRCKGTCGNDCYAAKIANLYGSVLKSYAKNTALWLKNPDVYWTQVNKAMRGTRFFRFHVSGDIPNYEYLKAMVASAINNEHCEVLVFTKRYELVNKYCKENGGRHAIPKNLHILFSGWKGLKPVNPYNFPETNIFTSEKDCNENWLICGGNCFECGCAGLGCWKASDGETVAFKKH